MADVVIAWHLNVPCRTPRWWLQTDPPREVPSMTDEIYATDSHWVDGLGWEGTIYTDGPAWIWMTCNHDGVMSPRSNIGYIDNLGDLILVPEPSASVGMICGVLVLIVFWWSRKNGR